MNRIGIVQCMERTESKAKVIRESGNVLKNL